MDQLHVMSDTLEHHRSLERRLLVNSFFGNSRYFLAGRCEALHNMLDRMLWCSTLCHAPASCVPLCTSHRSVLNFRPICQIVHPQT